MVSRDCEGGGKVVAYRLGSGCRMIYVHVSFRMQYMCFKICRKLADIVRARSQRSVFFRVKRFCKGNRQRFCSAQMLQHCLNNRLISVNPDVRGKPQFIHVEITSLAVEVSLLQK